MAPTYQGNLFAPPGRVLLDGQFVQGLAKFWRNTALSGGMTYQAVEAEIFSYHEGDLFTAKDDWLDPDRLRADQLWPKELVRTSNALENLRSSMFGDEPWARVTLEVGDLFGVDKRGTMNKFMALADGCPRHAQPAHLAPRLMFLDFARRIHCGRHKTEVWMPDSDC